jgi:hypothetical protein
MSPARASPEQDDVSQNLATRLPRPTHEHRQHVLGAGLVQSEPVRGIEGILRLRGEPQLPLGGRTGTAIQPLSNGLKSGANVSPNSASTRPAAEF